MKEGWAKETEEWMRSVLSKNVGCTAHVMVHFTITPSEWERGLLEEDNPGRILSNDRALP